MSTTVSDDPCRERLNSAADREEALLAENADLREQLAAAVAAITCEACGRTGDAGRQPAGPNPDEGDVWLCRDADACRDANQLTYLLWSNERRMWWRPSGRGYTDNIDEAGRYSQHSATRYALRAALCGRPDGAETIVVAPPTGRPT